MWLLHVFGTRGHYQEGKAAIDDLREKGLINGLKLSTEDFRPVTAFQVQKLETWFPYIVFTTRLNGGTNNIASLQRLIRIMHRSLSLDWISWSRCLPLSKMKSTSFATALTHMKNIYSRSVYDTMAIAYANTFIRDNNDCIRYMGY